MVHKQELGSTTSALAFGGEGGHLRYQKMQQNFGMELNWTEVND
jgi:hypothetical protein